MFPQYVEGSEFRVQPGITLGEEYNDNIFLEPENASSDFISQIAPSINVLYKVPLWDWNVSASYRYLYYARFHDSIKQSNIPDLDLANHTRIKEGHIFLDIRDSYKRVSLDPARDYTQESTFINQTDSNYFAVNPYFIIRPTSQMTVTTGYTYLNIWYKDPTAIDQVDNTVYTGLQHDLSQQSVMTAGIRHTQNKNAVQDFTRDDISLGHRYEYGENSTLSATIGNTWFHDKDNAERVTQVFWDADLTHRYSTVTVAVNTGLSFIPDPFKILIREDRYLASLRKDFERTSLIVAGGLIEYRGVKQKQLESKTSRLTGTINYAITPKSRVILNLNAEWLNDNQAGTSTDRYLAGVRFEHQTSEHLILALNYRYTNVYAPTDYSGSYENNRISIELRTAF